MGNEEMAQKAEKELQRQIEWLRAEAEKRLNNSVAVDL